MVVCAGVGTGMVTLAENWLIEEQEKVYRSSRGPDTMSKTFEVNVQRVALRRECCVKVFGSERSTLEAVE